VTLDAVEVAEAVVARVADANLRVPRDQFAAVWRAAERLERQQLPSAADWRAVAGVVAVCRWLAGVVDIAPVTGRTVPATPDAVETELDAAMAALDQTPPPAWLSEPAGWTTGVLAAFDWAWQGGDLPLIHHAGGVAARG